MCIIIIIMGVLNNGVVRCVSACVGRGRERGTKLAP